MNEHQEGPPFSESDLDSPAYRERLLRKLNYLIAVLEVAIGKVRRSLAGPEPDEERLSRIKKNLQDTLNVCMRARTALERRESLPEGLPESLTLSADENALAGDDIAHLPRQPDGARVEMLSEEEHRRFSRRGKIQSSEIADCDLDELSRLLQG